MAAPRNTNEERNKIHDGRRTCSAVMIPAEKTRAKIVKGRLITTACDSAQSARSQRFPVQLPQYRSRHPSLIPVARIQKIDATHLSPHKALRSQWRTGLRIAATVFRGEVEVC